MKAILTSWEMSLDTLNGLTSRVQETTIPIGTQRRQWHLVDDDTLYYKPLNAFDIAMQHLDTHYHLLSDEDIQSVIHSRGTRNRLSMHAVGLYLRSTYIRLYLPQIGVSLSLKRQITASFSTPMIQNLVVMGQ